MTQQQYIIQRKANILELGEKLGNISEACRKLGVSRQHFYDIKSAVEENGIDGLLEQSRKAPRIGNRVSSDVEEKILEYALTWPTHGQVRVSNELLKHQGVSISPGGVRGVWLRHEIQTKALRLKRLEKWSAEHGKVLTESQVQALENAKEEKQRTVKSRRFTRVFCWAKTPIMWAISRELARFTNRPQSTLIRMWDLQNSILIKRH